MHKAVKNKIISTKSAPGEYYIRDKVVSYIYPNIIESQCTKREIFPYGTPNGCDIKLFNEVLHTQSMYEVNICYLEEKFTDFPAEIKELMDITEYLTETLKTYSIRGNSSFGSNGGNASFEYKKTSNLCGVVTIYFSWCRGDEMGLVDWEEDETHIIPAVIYYNHKYYALTNAFIDWLKTPYKPLRQAFFKKIFYQ